MRDCRLFLLCCSLVHVPFGNAQDGVRVQSLQTIATAGEWRAVPQVGLGNEFIFQSVNETGLNAKIIEARSRMQRFPGGTPSGFWDWKSGWETARHEVDMVRRTTLPMLQQYLEATKQTTIVVPNIVTSNLTYELEGLRAYKDLGLVSHVELGNEIFDHSVPEILARYPDVQTYALAMEPWVSAVRTLSPDVEIALCGALNATWNSFLTSSPAAQSVGNITLHLYTSVPDGPYNTTTMVAKVLDQSVVASVDVERLIESSIPRDKGIWFTEMGAFHGNDIQDTFCLGLFMGRTLLSLTALPQTTLLLPYCAVCADPFMPAITTPGGPLPPPPNATYTPGPWEFTGTGVVESTIFQAMDGMDKMRQVWLQYGPQVTTDHYCELYGVGVTGNALPGSGRIVSFFQQCAEMCETTTGCVYWQWMGESDKRCYLKDGDSTFGGNGGSISGKVTNCNANVTDVNMWELSDGSSHTRFIAVNVGNSSFTVDYNPTLTNRKMTSISPKNFTEVTRQHVRISDLNVASVTIKARDTFVLPPYSVTLIVQESSKNTVKKHPV